VKAEAGRRIDWGREGRVPRAKLVLALNLALVTATGCADGGTVEFVSVRDSVGIEIVESSARQWDDGEAWTIGQTPILDLALSGPGPMHEFVTVRDVRRLADGRVVVVDEGVDEVRSYSSDGSFLSAIGREGEGPGEFQRPISIQPYGMDSLIVWDFWLRRITIVDADLGLGRVVTQRDVGRRLRPRMYRLEDSTFVGTFPLGTGSEDGLGYYRDPVELVRFVFGSGEYEQIATLAGGEGFSTERVDARPPFGRSSQIAVRDGQVIAGNADRMQFVVYDADGTVRQLFGVPSYDLSISRAERERELETLMPAEAPQFMRDLVQEMPVPETKPAYRSIRVDSEGYLWASRYQSYGDLDEAQVWEVFSPAGHWMGAVTTPARFDVLAVGANYVTGVFKDDFDVQHPQVLSLDRQGG
jgi:hypothetical protein